MKIETKFDLKQKVFYINDKNEISSGIIHNIRWDSAKGFSYFIPFLQIAKFRIDENELFATREEAEQKLDLLKKGEK